jgi:hypothetical protein
MSKRWLQPEIVHAIHRRDMESILIDLGLFDALLAGSLSCGICGRVLTLDTLQCLYLEESEIRLCCTNVECYVRVVSERGGPR